MGITGCIRYIGYPASLFSLHIHHSSTVIYDNSIGNYLIYMSLTTSMSNHIAKPLLAIFIAATLIAGLGMLIVPKIAFAQQITINGAGATFPFPLIDTWRVEYQTVKPEVSINYQSIGSGGGIKQFTEKTVDFGATDAPLTIERLNGLLVQFIFLKL